MKLFLKRQKVKRRIKKWRTISKNRYEKNRLSRGPGVSESVSKYKMCVGK